MTRSYGIKAEVLRLIDTTERAISHKQALTGKGIKIGNGTLSGVYFTLMRTAVNVATEKLIIDQIMARLYPFWETIRLKDTSAFFNTHLLSLFSDLKVSPKVINRIIDYLQETNEEGELYFDIEDYWSTLHTMIRHIIAYLNYKARLEKNPQTNKFSYTRPKRLRGINIVEEARRWDVKLAPYRKDLKKELKQ